MQQNMVVSTVTVSSESYARPSDLNCEESSYASEANESWHKIPKLPGNNKTIFTNHMEKPLRNGTYIPPRFQKLNADAVSNQGLKSKVSCEGQLVGLPSEPRKPSNDSANGTGLNSNYQSQNPHSIQETPPVPLYNPLPVYPFDGEGVPVMPYVSHYAVGSGTVYPPVYSSSPPLHSHSPEMGSDSRYGPMPGTPCAEGPMPSPYTYYPPQSMLMQPSNHYPNSASGWNAPNSIPIPMPSYMYPQSTNAVSYNMGST